jgi:hypothetical protein
MNALVCANRDAALLQSQAWIDSEGLGEVVKPKHFVQKIPLNKVYQLSDVYLFYQPEPAAIEQYRQEAAEINARKLNKIANLENQIKELRRNLPALTPLPEE